MEERKRKRDVLYPSFESELECVKGFRAFKTGHHYEMYSFGTALGPNGEKFKAWYIKNINYPNIKFEVKYDTMDQLIEDGSLIFLDPEKKLV